MELTPAQRRKLPVVGKLALSLSLCLSLRPSLFSLSLSLTQVFGISKFRDRSEGGGEGDTPEQVPALPACAALCCPACPSALSDKMFPCHEDDHPRTAMAGAGPDLEALPPRGASESKARTVGPQTSFVLSVRWQSGLASMPTRETGIQAERAEQAEL